MDAIFYEKLINFTSKYRERKKKKQIIICWGVNVAYVAGRPEKSRSDGRKKKKKKKKKKKGERESYSLHKKPSVDIAYVAGRP